MLEKVKHSIRVSVDDYDDVIEGLIEAAKLDLSRVGIQFLSEPDGLVFQAIVAFVRAHFGSPDDFDRQMLIYNNISQSLAMSEDYTDFGAGDY